MPGIVSTAAPHILEVGFNVGRRPPVEYADAVTLYYRGTGRAARLVWVDAARCWAVRVEPKPDDPRLGAWREGRLEDYPAEQVELVEYKEDARTIRRAGKTWTVPGYVGYDLEELGVSGLTEFLARADTWSGRGEFDSLSEAVAEQRRRQVAAREKAKAEARDTALQVAKSKRRQALGIPFLPVGITLKRPATTPAEDT